MAAFFSQVGYKSTGEWKEEIVFFDPDQGDGAACRRRRPPAAVFPDGTPAQLCRRTGIRARSSPIG